MQIISPAKKINNRITNMTGIIWKNAKNEMPHDNTVNLLHLKHTYVIINLMW